MYPKPNKHGAYSEDQAEIIEHKIGKSSVKIRLLQIEEDAWIKSLSFQYKNGGMGEPLSAYSKEHPSREKALIEALERLEIYSSLEASDISQWAREQIDQLISPLPQQLQLFIDR